MKTLDVEIHNLFFRYPDGQTALRGISFEIAPYERVALVGANGSGKSTLLLHLNGILRATSGQVNVCGMAVNDATIPYIRAKVGLLFQNPDDQLFSARVYDDVAFAPMYANLPEEEVQERVSRALEAVGMSGYASRISHHLSIGEKKRIALATILSMDTRILALDEPSSGLDPRARRDLIQLLKALPQQTLLVSTHDMRLAAELCTHAIVLNRGQIVASGLSETILYDRELLEQHGLETP